MDPTDPAAAIKAQRHGDRATAQHHDDPAAMTEAERQGEVAAILARGYLRLRRQHWPAIGANGPFVGQNAPETPPPAAGRR